MNDAAIHGAESKLDRFWMQPYDLRILEVVRRCYGVLLVLNIGLLWLDRRLFFGRGSWLPPEAARKVVDPDTWNLFSFGSDEPLAIDFALLALLVCGVLLFLGKRPRLVASISFVLLVAVHHANMMLFDAEDNLFRLFAFFLIFVPPWRQMQLLPAEGQGRDELRFPFPAWPLRLFQLQVCIVYLCSAIQKSNGVEWLEGTALYYALRLDDATRFPLPAFITESMGWLQALTWAVLAFEFLAPVLIWWRKTRWLCLVSAFVFHMATDYAMNLHLFHWIMSVGLLSFVRYDEFAAATRWIPLFRRRTSSETAEPLRKPAVVQEKQKSRTTVPAMKSRRT